MHLFSFNLKTGEAKDLTDELWLYDLAGGISRCLSRDEYTFGEVRFFSGDRLAVLGTDMARYSRGQSREVLTVDMTSGEILSPDELIDRIDAVTIDDARRIIDTYVDTSNMNITVVGPAAPPRKDQGESEN